jgi:hypothetical protein
LATSPIFDSGKPSQHAVRTDARSNKALAVVSIAKPEIESNLKDFLDRVLIPILVRDGLQIIHEENALAARTASRAECATEGENG